MAEKESGGGFMATAIKNQSEGLALLQRLTEVAQPQAVFAAPVEKGEYRVITASEVVAGLGFGYGLGGSSAAPEWPGQPGREDGGGGGGGGGFARARPVAVVTIGPKGVSVEPVVDASQIALAFFTMIGSFLFMLLRLRRGSKRRSQRAG